MIERLGNSLPTLVVVHGGFWKRKWNIDNAGHHKLAPHFVGKDWAVVEVEYRRCQSSSKRNSVDPQATPPPETSVTKKLGLKEETDSTLLGNLPEPTPVPDDNDIFSNLPSLPPIAPLIQSGVRMVKDFASRIQFGPSADPASGMYPNAINDVTDAIQFLYTLKTVENLPLDLGRVVVMGHSAGGQLAILAGKNSFLMSLEYSGNDEATLSPDEHTVVVPVMIVTLAPVTDLVEGAKRSLSDEGTACQVFMGGSLNDPLLFATGAGGGGSKDGEGNISLVERYRRASPIHQLPIGIPQVVVMGIKDTDIPGDMIRDYSHRAKAKESGQGVVVTLIEMNECDHMDLVNPDCGEWAGLELAMEDTMTMSLVQVGGSESFMNHSWCWEGKIWKI